MKKITQTKIRHEVDPDVPNSALDIFIHLGALSRVHSLPPMMHVRQRQHVVRHPFHSLPILEVHQASIANWVKATRSTASQRRHRRARMKPMIHLIDIRGKVYVGWQGLPLQISKIVLYPPSV